MQANVSRTREFSGSLATNPSTDPTRMGAGPWQCVPELLAASISTRACSIVVHCFSWRCAWLFCFSLMWWRALSTGGRVSFDGCGPGGLSSAGGGEPGGELAEAIARDGLQLAGWVANIIDPKTSRLEENLATLAERLPAPCLGRVPKLKHASAEAVAEHLQLDLLD